MSRTLFLSLLALAFTCFSSSLRAQDDEGFRPLFDGSTLDGWSSPDMRYWSVEDGAITGRSSDDLPGAKNQFLVWQLGTVDDFDLRLKFRLLGDDSANSGVQIRSHIAEDGHAVGYQADIDRGATWLGALYDEHTGRQILARRGERAVFDAAGARNATLLPLDDFRVEPDGWNDYRVVARGEQIRIFVNGALTCEVVDGDAKERDLSGRLAVQLHSGPPATVQFKDIALKRLPLAGERKKIVLIAGPPSHPSGQHEFNAGVKLLHRRLAELDGVIPASYHDGWPQDPTALDNADAIVIYADGQGRHPIMKHFEEVDALMAKGAGLMCMHYAVHVEPGAEGDHFQKWIGGFYETGFSTNPHWTADLTIGGDHPITRGLAPGKIHDEWYFSIRFREGMKDVTTILAAKPDEKARAKNNYPPRPYQHIIDAAGKIETLMWAVERPDGGRGVGFTGGHWHRNWAHPLQLRAILNAMLWVAKADVPEGGVEAEPVSEEELNENLDAKKNMVRVEPPEGVGG